MASPVIARGNRIMDHWRSTYKADLCFNILLCHVLPPRLIALFRSGIFGRAITKAAPTSKTWRYCYVRCCCICQAREVSCSLVGISVGSIASIFVVSLSVSTSCALIVVQSPASTTSSTTIQGSWYLTLRLRIECDLWVLGMGPTYLGFRDHWEFIAVVSENLRGSANVGVVVLWAWATEYEL